jgi:hypothetical protein
VALLSLIIMISRRSIIMSTVMIFMILNSGDIVASRQLYDLCLLVLRMVSVLVIMIVIMVMVIVVSMIMVMVIVVIMTVTMRTIMIVIIIIQVVIVVVIMIVIVVVVMIVIMAVVMIVVMIVAMSPFRRRICSPAIAVVVRIKIELRSIPVTALVTHRHS